MAEKKLFLLDGFALIYRAFYSLGKNFLYNSKGQNTTAVRGFTTTLVDLIKKENPTHIALVMDAPGPTDRAVEYEFYKANREAMPEELRASLPYIRKVAEGFRIPILEVPGYEADDVIGTMAKDAEKEGYQVFMVTPDKDYGQLVSENIFMYKPPFRGKPREIYGIPEILEKWDIVRIDQVIDILGLMGDAVDNIPGIPGVGEKTAIKLLKQFDTMEGLLENTDQLKGKLKEKVEANVEQAKISKHLATILLDAPIAFEYDDLVLEKPDSEILAPLFAEMEFRTLGKRILGDEYSVNQEVQPSTGQQSLFASHNEVNASLFDGAETTTGSTLDTTPHDYKMVDTPESRAALLKDIMAQKAVCFDTETTSVDPNNCEIVGIAFSWKKSKAFYVPLPENQEETQAIINEFKPFFEDENIVKIGQNLKYDIVALMWHGIECKGKVLDTMLQHYLIETDMRHNMDILAETYLGYTPVSIESLIGKKGKKQGSMRDVAPEKVTEYAGEDADITYQLHEKFTPVLAENKLDKLYDKVEGPVVKVLAEMEYNGVNLDVGFLENYTTELKTDILEYRTSIHEDAGMEFNIDSTKQLGEVLFDHLKIPYKGKKNTKSGWYSTSEEVLLKIADDHAIVGKILEYRGINKLLNTYVEALPKLINPKTNRVHTTFNQAVAATGRLSSTNPNLQNIPIRTERGRKVRKAFIPRDENHILLAADYSQIELRLIAEISNDTNMKQAFIDGVDIHSATAAKVFGVDLEAVDKDMRRSAKMVNFGIIYGISAFGLSQRLGIPRKEAKALIEGYFATYKGIERYMTDVVELAREKGYAETIMGRRRYLKDINSSNGTVRKFAERNAINSPIQGSAADLIKLAMIDVHNEMKRRELKSKMILQVHDELLFDAHKNELEELTDLVKDKMANAFKLDVPLVVDAGTGQNWLQAH